MSLQRGKEKSTRNVLRLQVSVLIALGIVLAFGQIALFQISLFHHHYSAGTEHLPPSLAESKLGSPGKAAIHGPSVVDGTFNGLNLVYKEKPPISNIHCVGENYQADAWIGRSCDFQNLCFDVEEGEFVIFRSHAESTLNKAVRSANDRHVVVSTSSGTRPQVAIGGINPKWNIEGYSQLKWFPKVVQSDNVTEGYYELPSNVVWIPFHSLAGFNPGHLVWDDLLPAYTLLSMFSHLDKQPLMMRYVLDPGLWASCDLEERNRILCGTMFRKFTPLMGVDPSTFSTNREFVFNTTAPTPRSKYVCSRYGVAGIGLLTDHGMKFHGWYQNDYQTTHNHGRGGSLYQFRNFALSNSGIPIKPVKPSPPYKITFSINSSRGGSRSQNMKMQADAVKEAFGDMVVVQSLKMSDFTLEEQVRIAAESAIYITVCGGGAVTATFLPKGSSLIVYFDPNGGLARGSTPNGLPARLDWDIFNNAAHIRTHWLPHNTMSRPVGIKTLVELIRYELETLQSNDEQGSMPL